MRVLIAIPSLSGGGAEFVAEQWARHLVHEGDDVTVYLTHPESADTAPDGVSLVKARPGHFVMQARDLERHLKDNPTDVVLGLMTYSNLLSIVATRLLGGNRPRVIISERTLAHAPQTGRRVSIKSKRLLAQRLYRYADLFVAISHPVGAESIAEYRLSPERVLVVPNPSYAKAKARHSRRNVQTFDANCLDIIVPARLVAVKRPLIAVDVAASVSAAFPGDVRLHFFGVGPLHDEIVSRARQANVDVVMHGWIHNWFEHCPAGSVVLVTSIVEGFSNVLVEAAATGLRSVAASRCLGVADAVVPGITGELTSGNSAEDYAAAILAMSREPVRDVESWLERFSLENSGRILRDAFLLLAEPRVGRAEDIRF
jgi:glycosyltransferase involved in cell wall biosynthesis